MRSNAIMISNFLSSFLQRNFEKRNYFNNRNHKKKNAKIFQINLFYNQYIVNITKNKNKIDRQKYQLFIKLLNSVVSLYFFFSI